MWGFIKTIIIFLLLLGLGLGVYLVATNRTVTVVGYQSANVIKQQEIVPEPGTILVVGDIMLDRGVEARVRNVGGGDWKFPFEKIADRTHQADILFGNHEGAISDIGTDGGKKYSFRFKPAAGEGLRHAGFDVMALANNHGWDWGRDALCDSYNTLAEYDIAAIGGGCNSNQAEAPYIQTIGGKGGETTVAFLAYTPFYAGGYATESQPGFSRWDTDAIRGRIQSVKQYQDVDLVFVSVHMGDEYQQQSNQKQQEIYRSFVDAGADVIVGHHPHVVQEIEQYNDGWILYSLGNFVFDQYFSEETMEGVMVEFQVMKGEITSMEPIQTKINKNYQVYLTE